MPNLDAITEFSAATNHFAPHITFEEYDTDDTNAFPCVCWIAGRAEQDVITDDDVLHPDAWLDGRASLLEYNQDLWLYRQVG